MFWHSHGGFRACFLTFAILIVSFFFSVFSPKLARAAELFVDGNLGGNCSGNYSISLRNCSGSDGDAYQTLDGGITNLTSGDTLYIRAGTYLENDQTIPQLGNYAAMTTISGYQNESVTWQNNTIYFYAVGLDGNANNITIQKINFVGIRYVGSDDRTWELYDTNTWRTTTGTQPPSEVVELKSGCNPTTFACTKSEGLAGSIPEKTSIAEVTSGTDGDFFQDYPTDYRIYLHSTTDPGSRTDVWETGVGITIGNDSSSTGYIVINNNTFSGSGHAHLKGGYRWNVYDNTFQEVGTDANDHIIYSFGVLTAGNEAIYERNYFKSDAAMGAALHLYNGGTGPEYHIIRYNIIQGAGEWAVAAYGQHLTVTNNSVSLENGIMGFELVGGFTNNVFTNNILIGPVQLSFFEYTGTPTNETVQNNITYNGTFSRGSCSGCTVSGNLSGTDPVLIDNTPETFDDYRLQSGSPARDTGLNLGAGYDSGFDNSDTTWPLSTLDQDDNGSGWEIGAFVYNDLAPTPTPTPTPTPVPTLTPTSSSDFSMPTAPECHDESPGKTTPYLYGAIAQDSRNIILYFTGAGDPVDKYILQFGKKAGIYTWGSPNIGWNSTRIYLVRFLAPNTTYYFRIRAGNGCSVGEWSNVISARTKSSGSSNIIETQTSSTGCTRYTVKRGNSLWLIAKKLLGKGSLYNKIIEQNLKKYPSMRSSNIIFSGWDLEINCPN